MFTSEELSCIVCFNEYSRTHHIPRVLHCNHTFCTPCLEKLSKLQCGLHTISCPLCRWITCTQATLALPSVLFINMDVWDQMVEEQKMRMESGAEELTDTETILIKSKISHSKHSGFKSALWNLLSCVVMRK